MATAAMEIYSPEPEMTIYTAEENKKMLGKYLKTKSDFVIDLAKVSEIDSAGLQLLLLAKMECEKRKKSLRIENACEAVVDVFEICNLVDLLHYES